MASTLKQADANSGLPIEAQASRKTRRVYAAKFKREIVAQCLMPGASVSAIALRHGINANVIRKWLPRQRSEASAAVATMLPVSIRATTMSVASTTRMQRPPADTRPSIEVSLGSATIRLPVGFDPAELRSIVQILAALR